MSPRWGLGVCVISIFYKHVAPLGLCWFISLLVHWSIMVDIRINETLQTGAVRKPHLPFSRLVGTVSNSAYAVRLETAPTGGESVYLFLEFTIN